MILIQAGKDLWYQYENPVEIVSAVSLDEVIPLLERLESKVEKQGYYAAGYLRYEAAPAFDTALETHPASGEPLIWFALYRHFRQGRLRDLLDKTDYPGLDELLWSPGVDKADYHRAIDRIHQYLESGQTYQVNYTMPLQGPVLSGDKRAKLGLFRHLQEAQQGAFGAWIDCGEEEILSISPEMFFEQQGERILCRPMKGTAPRGFWPEKDFLIQQELYHSEKNRAENLMILDMIRNDLGKIARPASVKVEELFTMEAYPTVHQVVSQASCLSDGSLCDIFRALFPCASITGAPKVRTMQIIKELEPSPRGVYTGSIGFLHPGKYRRFNVAIRTLINQKSHSSYHVGGGILWDSRKEDEYEEALLKSRVVNQPLVEFDLLETMLWIPDSGLWLKKEHLERLEWSARFFGFPFFKDSFLEGIDELHQKNRPHRIRCTLDRAGRLDYTFTALEEVPRRLSSCSDLDKILKDKAEKSFTLSENPVHSGNPLLYHKTTERSVYTHRTQEEADFTLLQNEKGELTEFTIGNLLVKKEGKLLTPPLDCGLLPGVFRRWLLEKQWVEEAPLMKEDLQKAEGLYLINSVRQIVPVNPVF